MEKKELFDNVSKVLDSISTVLKEKNKRYGNSALEPIHVFYKGDAENSILIRLDDKLSRIKNSEELRNNDVFDLLGYLFLLQINSLDSSAVFENKVNYVVEQIMKRLTNFIETCETDKSIYFTKADDSIQLLTDKNFIIRNLDNTFIPYVKTMEEHDDEIIVGMMLFITLYFVSIGKTDFSELID